MRRLGAEDSSVDLIGMDVIWTGEFANAGWIDPLPAQTAEVVSEDVFPSVLRTAEFEGELYAAPLWSNTQLLWYRSDLVPNPPTTWEEMIAQAEQLPPGENLIQVQANKYEGLVVWANQMIESAGTSILANPDEVELSEAETKEALATMGALSTSSAADPGITTSEEDPARLAFESGSSAFMINYPFVYPSAEENAPDIFKVMKAAKYPGISPDIPSAPPLGGINLGVSAFSENKDLAFEAIECLVGAENQIATADAGGLPRCARTSTTRPRSRRSIRATPRSSASRSPTPPRGPLSHRPTRTSRSRSRAPSTRPPTSTPRTRRTPTTTCARSSSRRSTGRACCERRHRHR